MKGRRRRNTRNKKTKGKKVRICWYSNELSTINESTRLIKMCRSCHPKWMIWVGRTCLQFTNSGLGVSETIKWEGRERGSIGEEGEEFRPNISQVHLEWTFSLVWASLASITARERIMWMHIPPWPWLHDMVDLPAQNESNFLKCPGRYDWLLFR